jgi:hypothetical protein
VLGQSTSLHIHLNVSERSLHRQIIGNTELYIRYDSNELRIPIDTNFDFFVSDFKSNYKLMGIYHSYFKEDSCPNGYALQFFGFKDTIFKNLSADLKSNLGTNIVIKYPLECEYDKNRCNNICPKCKKKDRVLQILFGLIVEDPRKEYVPQRDYYPGGCSPQNCHPNWYCERDKLSF